MGRSIVLLIGLLQVRAQHVPSRLAQLQQAGTSAQEPEGGDDDGAERMVIVHEHQHVHEHTHEHEHVHEHAHVHEHEHEITVLAPAPAALPVSAPSPAAQIVVPTLAPITTTVEPPALDPAMAQVVLFDERQLDANIQRMAGSLNTVTSQLNHLRNTLVRWGPSLTTLQAGAAADLAVVTANQATFQRLRGTISEEGVQRRLNPMNASIITMEHSSAAIGAQLGAPGAAPAAGEEGGAALQEGNITHQIQTVNNTLILAKPIVKAKLEELRSIEERLTRNVTEYTDHVAGAATDDILREIPNQLASQVTDAMNQLDH